MYKLRTVDVWDTLIRRKCHPEAVKLATARYILLRAHNEAKEEFATPFDIYTKRQNVELLLAKEAELENKDGEYRIEEVVRRLLKEVTSLGPSAKLDDFILSTIEFELDFEKKHTFVDPEIIDFLSLYPAQKTIYLSDFYMGSELLNRLLEHHGLDALVDDGVVSCDLMLNKRSGRLFEHIEQREGVLPHEHIHIGDNPYSDFDSPRKIGIHAISYLPQKPHEVRLNYESMFESREFLAAQVHKDLNSRLGNQRHIQSSDDKVAFQLGLEAAPLFVGFALFLAERSILDGVSKLYFFTREGEFFSKVYEELFPDLKLAGHDIPPPSILEVSRQATFTASLNTGKIDEFDRIWSLHSDQSLKNLFNIIGIEGCNFDHILEKNGLNKDELINIPSNKEKIAKVFSNREFQSVVQKIISEKKKLLQYYLEGKGVSSGEKVGFVDIGWRGTIQDNIAQIIPSVSSVGYYMALRSFLNRQPTNTTKYAYGPDERYEYDADIFEAFEPLEMICSSRQGSVLGYKIENGDISAVRGKEQSEDLTNSDFVQSFQDGVITAVRFHAPLIASHSITSTEMRELALRIWRNLANRPPKELITAYYAQPEHDVFGYGGVFDRSVAPTLRDLVAALFWETQRRKLVQYLRRTQWRAAIANLEVGTLNRWALHAVFTAAHCYKNIRRRRMHTKR